MMHKNGAITGNQEEINVKELMQILSMDLFRSVVNSNSLKLCQLNSLISLLFKEGVQFNLSFTPATAASEATATLTIYVNPKVTISLNISFDTGELLGIF